MSLLRLVPAGTERNMHRPSSRPIPARNEPDLGAYSPVMQRVVSVAARVARFDSTILVTGESGVGKERLARFIHRASPRAGGPFIPVNCGALPDALFESELFGHARGAFSGALNDRQGLFEAAEGGTLLLDEVGEVPLPMQVKLLRVLQDREIRRVGENRQRRVNVRLIAATNRPLARDIADGRFRRDLYYRLKVVELHVPPLREWPEDLRGLAEALLVPVARRLRRPILKYTPAALERILAYSWPGNVRELENAVEQACALATGDVLDVGDLPDELQQAPALPPSPNGIRPLRDVEREYILAALERHGGNKTLTAQQLRIAPATLFRKLKRYGRESA